MLNISYDYMGPFSFPCLNPKSYLELPSPPKPEGIQISVCATTWKRTREIIVTSIESIYKQSFPIESYEVLLIDDATDGPRREDLVDAVAYLMREYPNHNFRVYFTDHTRCWNDAHPLNVVYRRALGWILLQSQTDLIHVGETLESAWRHHNYNDHLRLCPAHYGAYKLLDTDGPKWQYFPHEFGASYLKRHVLRVKGRNETITWAPPDVDFQDAMRQVCGLVALEDPSVRTLHRGSAHPPPESGLEGRRAGAPRYYDGDQRLPDRTWTSSDNWGILTPEEERMTMMTETMRKVLRENK